MSKLRLPDGDDHPDAATKNLDDALTLLNAGRADGAAYLAGYVIECALKSLILLNSVTLWKTHSLTSLSSEALRLAALPGSRTARYGTPTAGHAMYDATTGWRETLRYRTGGAVPAAVAAAWLGEAQAVYSSTVARMKLDGVL